MNQFNSAIINFNFTSEVEEKTVCYYGVVLTTDFCGFSRGIKIDKVEVTDHDTEDIVMKFYEYSHALDYNLIANFVFDGSKWQTEVDYINNSEE